MVVDRYCRTISFPNLNRPNPKPTSSPSSKSYHVRSTSLPCGRTHPLIPQLKDDISLLLSWPQSKPILTSLNHHTHTTSSWLVNGLAQLKTVLDSLDHVLQIPLVHNSLSRSIVDNALDHFLRFLDVFGIFHTSLLALKLELSSAQVAVRCKDEAKLISYVKFHKKTAKEMSKLLSSIVRSADDFPIGGEDQTDEITMIIRDVLGLTTSVLAAVLESVLTSLGSTLIRSVSSWVGLGFSKKLKKGEDEMKGALKRMQEMEEYIEGLEKGSGKVLRSLISTRVSLLNILTHF